ncbi:MAG: 50S ribosomal protein L18e [archaeon]|nr:50S ribosomal protein L18e [Candidatus Micrarchaeota archaeon]
MKATGPTKLETKKFISKMKKEGKKRKEKLWIDVAKRIEKSRRTRVSVNLWKIDKMSKKFKGKILLVPGKVLSTGSIESKAEVAALEFSEKALKKIKEKKGNAMSLNELLEKKTKAKEIVILK